MVQSQVLQGPESQRPEEEARVILLASAAAEGDEGAFAELYKLLSQRVFNLVLRSVHDRPTAEDLCQEIWLRVHREIRGLRAPEAMRSWLYRIASRACVDFARSSRGKHRKEEDGIDEFVAAFGHEPEESAIVGNEVRLMWQTLGAMAPRQSIALYLKQVDGLSYDEIASVLDCSRPTVEALLFRARQSFVRAYRRVESSQEERCEMFAQVMASVIDNEPTALQRSALESHAADCMSCRPQLVEMRRANNAYLALPLMPIGKTLALETILAGGGVAAGAGIFSAASGLLGAGA
ncbi:MAG TPA: RNA polymerase sigma factor, partial [Dehalococcoidia bacterium]